RSRPVRRDAVLARQAGDHVRRDPLEQRRQIRLDARVGEAVQPLERREQQQQLLERVGIELPARAQQRMSETVRDSLARQVLGQAIDVTAALLDVLVLRGGDVPRKYVHDAAVLGKQRGDLLGKKEIRAFYELEPT